MQTIKQEATADGQLVFTMIFESLETPYKVPGTDTCITSFSAPVSLTPLPVPPCPASGRCVHFTGVVRPRARGALHALLRPGRARGGGQGRSSSVLVLVVG